MKQKPTISVIIPVFNRSSLIHYTIDSVIGQTFKDWECLVVDDGSTDDSEAVVQRYCERDTRFKFYKRPSSKPKGANACRNYGLELGVGTYIVFLDSDDLLHSTALEKRLEVMQRKQNDMVVSHSMAFKERIGDMDLVWNRMAETSSNEALLIRYFNTDMPWCTNAVLWSRDFLLKVGGWNEQLVAWQDWDIHVRSLIMDAKVEIMTGAPDNFVRHTTEGHIGSLYRTKSYYISLCYMVSSIGVQLKRSMFSTSKPVLSSYHVFVLIWCVQKPIIRGFKFLPIKMLFKKRLFNQVSVFKYVKTYMIQGLIVYGQRNKFVYNLFRRLIEHQVSALEINSTHNKLKIEDLSRC
ncbi:glycosyltransferase family 2 protein [Gaetbulibacter sp. NE]|uniref:glycosyltransferase family 2 protein n=1 Tax=Gaetbulibacter sp. NE TaxID=2982307 RepID=UPI0021CF78F8|nr:glycosyltransferase family 2 protein [Gaetbulibacter sp. NE]